MKKRKVCNLCGSKEFKKLYRLDSRNFVECENCRLIFVIPQPTDKQLNEIYSNYFGDVIDPDGRKRNWLKEEHTRLREHKKEIKQIEKFKKRGKILDIGAATGCFLAALNNNWEKYGVEIEKVAVQYAKKKYGLKIFHGNLTDAKFKPNFFDVVNMSHVVEHMRDPMKNLKKAYRILKKDGIIVIATPNSDSFCYKVFKSRFRLLCGESHLYLFSTKTLKEMLRKAGFKIIKISYPYFNTPFFNIKELINLLTRVIILKVYAPIINGLGIRYSPSFVSPPFYGNVVKIIAKK